MSSASPTVLPRKKQWDSESISLGIGAESDRIIDSYQESMYHYYIPVSRQLENPSIRFTMLKRKWEAETAMSSSVTEISIHSAYQEIIGMGPIAIPYILSELRQKPGHWFWALNAITGENPVAPEHRGNIRKMTEDWLRWGKANGY